MNLAVPQQDTTRLRHTGTSKWDLVNVNQDGTCCTICNIRTELWQTGPGDVCWVVGEGCVFFQPGHCVDSKSRWFTGVFQRLFTHKWKPWGNQNCLQVGMSDCLVQQLKCRVRFMNHQSVWEFYDAAAQEKQICGHDEQFQIPQKEKMAKTAKNIQTIPKFTQDEAAYLTTTNNNEYVLLFMNDFLPSSATTVTGGHFCAQLDISFWGQIRKTEIFP